MIDSDNLTVSIWLMFLLMRMLCSNSIWTKGSFLVIQVRSNRNLFLTVSMRLEIDMRDEERNRKEVERKIELDHELSSSLMSISSLIDTVKNKFL